MASESRAVSGEVHLHAFAEQLAERDPDGHGGERREHEVRVARPVPPASVGPSKAPGLAESGFGGALRVSRHGAIASARKATTTMARVLVSAGSHCIACGGPGGPWKKRSSVARPFRFVRRHVTKGIKMAVKLRIGAAVALCVVAAAVYAATALRFGAEVNVSRTASPTRRRSSSVSPT